MEFFYIIAVWCVIAFLYSKIKGVSFWKANKRMILAIFKGIFSSNKSQLKDLEKRAYEEDRPDIAEKINQRREINSKMTSKIESMDD